MPARRPPRGREAQIAFEALSIEGGLLTPEWLARVAQLDAGGQSEADYRIPKGLQLRDEIGRYWRIAQAHWADFADAKRGAGDGRGITERFILGLLREGFGFGSLSSVAPVEIDGRVFPIGFQALGGRVPVVIAPLPPEGDKDRETELDTPSPQFGDGGRRRSAFGLVQEYLNAEDAALWGLCTDGILLRVARDNGSLTRPAFIEADLGRIFAEQRYADFAALWLLIHETRFGSAERPPAECPLEAWRNAGREEGMRARDQLRRGVEEALLALGQGFLTHPQNQRIRDALHSGSLTKDAYFQELLRLVYRLIFVLTAEERGLLHPTDASATARDLYARGYSLRALRDRSLRRSAHDTFNDVWEGLKIVLRGLARGEPRLGLPALGGLFAEDQCRSLDGARLENRVLLSGIFKLSWLRTPFGVARVNWRDMGPEELGSVYESLLELVPRISDDQRTFSFAAGGETTGNARKLTGSYYTPEDLVRVLLDTALDPVVHRAIADNPGDPAEALLHLTIVDPACGSGHFLIAAAHRVAGHVARLRVAGTPSILEYRHALRQVVGRCLFGVDLNPMAVELCKVNLWMEALEPGRPLSFLDSHVQRGNALFGATQELLERGIPDEAWDPLEGDDRKVASALKKDNKRERLNPAQKTLDFGPSPASTYGRIAQGARDVDAAADETLSAVEQKRVRWGDFVSSRAYSHERLVADVWCSAFVWKKLPGALREEAPTEAKFRALRDDESRATRALRDEVAELERQYHFFHWHLSFPQVFSRGGFDVVLGNPPWERVKLQEQEFFAPRNEIIAHAPNAAARKKMIAALPQADPRLWEEWVAALREADGQTHFVRGSGRYPLCGKGDINTYALFAEHNRAILRPEGRAGFITPPGLATDDTTKAYFQDITARSRLVCLYEFENEEFLFPGIDHRVHFITITLTGTAGHHAAADISFANRNVSSLSNPERHFSLTSDDFALLNPNTRTCPTFRSKRDAELNKKLYRASGVLWREGHPDGNPWGTHFMAMFHMANDSGLFRNRLQLESGGWMREGNRYKLDKRHMLPLIEAKMVHHFDHRFGTYEGQTEAQANQNKLPELDDAAHANFDALPVPKYWVGGDEIEARLETRWGRGWLLGWRDVCRSSDQRTLIASLIPRAAVGDKFLLMLPSREPTLVAALYANLCSFVLDYCARQKVGGTSLKYFTMRQLPVLSPEVYLTSPPWDPTRPARDWFLPRVLELVFTASDIESFARDCGYEGGPFLWDRERRFALRAEIDAAFFHLYGALRGDVEHILDTFPVVRKNDEKAHGEYRTKRAILEVYDQMAAAMRVGRPYPSPLNIEANG